MHKRLNQVIMPYTQKVKTECFLMWYIKMCEILENLFGLGVGGYTITTQLFGKPDFFSSKQFTQTLQNILMKLSCLKQ